MKVLLYLLLTVSALALSGCERERGGTQPAEIALLRKELADAKRELDELKHGPARMLARAEAAATKSDWAATKKYAEDLLARHPASSESDRAKQLVASSVSALAKAAKEAELAEARRLEAERVKRVQEERRLAAALGRMYQTVDAIENITWYRDRSSPRHENANGFYLYIGKRSGSDPWLRLRVQYNAEDWLFIQSFLVVADGQRFEYPEVNFERDHSGGRIWEWYDEPATSSDLDLVNAIIGSKSAVIRFNGRQYRRDRTITASEKAALRNVLDAYKVLAGT